MFIYLIAIQVSDENRPSPLPANASMHAICLDRVRLDRGGRAVQRDISLAVPRGGITAIPGPSGSGKYTLLAALTGELGPVGGRIEVLGRDGGCCYEATVKLNAVGDTCSYPERYARPSAAPPDKFSQDMEGDEYVLVRDAWSQRHNHHQRPEGS